MLRLLQLRSDIGGPPDSYAEGPYRALSGCPESPPSTRRRQEKSSLIIPRPCSSGQGRLHFLVSPTTGHSRQGTRATFFQWTSRPFNSGRAFNRCRICCQPSALLSVTSRSIVPPGSGWTRTRRSAAPPAALKAFWICSGEARGVWTFAAGADGSFATETILAETEPSPFRGAGTDFVATPWEPGPWTWDDGTDGGTSAGTTGATGSHFGGVGATLTAEGCGAGRRLAGRGRSGRGGVFSGCSTARAVASPFTPSPPGERAVFVSPFLSGE